MEEKDTLSDPQGNIGKMPIGWEPDRGVDSWLHGHLVVRMVGPDWIVGTQGH